MTLPAQDIVERLPIEKQIKYALFLAAGQDDPHSVTITELCASLSRLTADNEALRKTNEHWRRQSRDSFEAFSAMRDAINEVVPMQSAEADLLDGPELFVSCEAVALAVVSRVTALEADVGRLREVVSKVCAALPNGAFCSPECSIEFMEQVPGEVAGVVGALQRAIEFTAKMAWRTDHVR